MNIDWAIVIAQIVNFIGLVWLLHRFLYAPIVNVISAREAALKERFERAKSLQAEAAREIARYEAKRTELEQTREQYLQEARDAAGRTLNELLDKAHADARAARRRLAEQIALERQELEQALQAGVVAQVSAASQQLLAALAGRSVADGLIDAFEKQLLADAAEGESSQTATPSATRRPMRPPITVRLSFEPTAEQKSRLRRVLEQAAGRSFGDQDVHFLRDKSLVLGLELHYDGSKISWHARHLLGEWEMGALQRLAAMASTDADGDGTSDAADDGGPVVNADMAADGGTTVDNEDRGAPGDGGRGHA